MATNSIVRRKVVSLLSRLTSSSAVALGTNSRHRVTGHAQRLQVISTSSASKTERCKPTIMAYSKIKTFVPLVMETTGLPGDDGSLPDVIELALIAVTRDQIESRPLPIGQQPRLTNRLLLCMSPMKTIEDAAKELHKVDGSDLSSFKPMDVDVYNAIKSFLNRLPKPVCLVAHNGNQFHFPILRHELSKVSGDMPEVRAIDSKEFFMQTREEPSYRLRSLADKYLEKQQTWQAEKDAEILMELVFFHLWKNDFTEWADANSKDC
ncbi:three prime repair exonuclease 2-like [Ptychodera flava]|uniref:three prime repair exonuclease 2-like n=1 Tax=Ptychodera flava TaxID=63121 RepID=UPI00396A905F